MSGKPTRPYLRARIDGEPYYADTLTGTGPVTCECRNHKARCAFGAPHRWHQWHYQGALVRSAEATACQCGAVCLGEPASSSAPPPGWLGFGTHAALARVPDGVVLSEEVGEDLMPLWEYHEGCSCAFPGVAGEVTA